MVNTGIIGPAIILANILVSYKGFKDQAFLSKNKFEVDRILVDKDFKRIIASGFLHANWSHLIFNMLSLYAFSEALESEVGTINFLILYFVSLIGGDLLALFIHKNHGEYSAVGASGAICGIIFASIALIPGIKIGLLFIPYHIPGWLFGVIYILYSIYGIQSKKDNIGHEAHLGGALFGILIAIIMRPEIIPYNYLTILSMVIPIAIFLYLIIKKPEILLVNNASPPKVYHFDIDHKYNEEKANEAKNIDTILKKIKKSGMGSLTQQELDALDEYSKKD